MAANLLQLMIMDNADYELHDQYRINDVYVFVGYIMGKEVEQ